MRSFALKQDQFTGRVDGWVGSQLERAPASFGALLRVLPGVDPGLVVTSLARFADQPSCPRHTRALAATLLGQARIRVDGRPASARPIPHPLDCYWANDALTLRALTSRLGQLTSKGDSIAYLGWPNAFADARPRLPGRAHVLLERDVQRAAALRDRHQPEEVRTTDVLRDPLPDLQARVIVADPPWYPDELRSFVWAAARLAKAGARILLALPPIGTRPGIEVERRDVLDWAALCGLRAGDVQAASLGYLCPPFERAALDAQGILGTPDNWRRGDLLTFEIAPTNLPARPPVADEAWHRTQIGELPFRVRVEHQVDPGQPLDAGKLLEPIIEGDVLPTVSRRSADRRRARLWTSRNRVFASSNGHVLAATAEAVAGGTDVVQAAAERMGRHLAAEESEAVRIVAARLQALVVLERGEHGLD